MVNIYSSALNQSIQIDRIIGAVKGNQPGPCLIFIGGIHGNEPAGVFALYQVIKSLKSQRTKISGAVYALAGNLKALEQSKRFIREDLNRMWDEDKIKGLKNGAFDASHNDQVEQKELFDLISDIQKTENGPFYFFDLHTTSSRSIPFLTVNDTLLNRAFTRSYPVPKILGVEEFLEGPLLSYLNEKGFVSFGFESGQHDTLEAIENHVAFIYLSLFFTASLKNNLISLDLFYSKLEAASAFKTSFFEIYHRHEIKIDDTFIMIPGYSNFQAIRKGDVLAISNKCDIKASRSSLMFMPLYQDQGDDGFFFIRKIPYLFMWLSALFRKWHFDWILRFLPGVSWHKTDKDTLIVNKKIAFLMVRQLLHLMGYRNKRLDKYHLIIKSRETASKRNAYKNEIWY